MIDPLECVLSLLREDPELVELTGGRIASKHSYGVDWPLGSTSVVVRPDGGRVNNYADLQVARLEIRSFAPSEYEASAVWRRIVQICRETSRRPIPTSEGNALLYSFIQVSAPSDLYDDRLELDFRVAFYEAMVSEQAVEA